MIAGSYFQKRLALLKDGLKKSSLDSIIITGRINVTYLSGFSGHDSIILVTLDKNYFITDSRYVEEAEAELVGFSVKLVEKSTYDTILEIIGEGGLKNIGFEAMDLQYGVAARLMELIKNAALVPCKNMVERIRAIKDPEEIASLRDSIGLNKRVFDRITALVKPGATERSIAGMIETAYIDEGARAAFDPIVASGENSSKPHAAPADVSIKNNSFVMIDMGAKLNGYCSDYTRMVVLGRTKEKFKKIYSVVKAAQEKAIDAIRPGVRICDVDAAGRNHIAGEGFGKYFGHSLGHGIGLDVHEEPTVSSHGEGCLASGMVFTVEPAIYVPRFGGVRIEDVVMVTDDGCEVLTK